VGKKGERALLGGKKRYVGRRPLKTIYEEGGPKSSKGTVGGRGVLGEGFEVGSIKIAKTQIHSGDQREGRESPGGAQNPDR